MHELADSSTTHCTLRENPLTTNFLLNGPPKMKPVEPNGNDKHNEYKTAPSAQMLRWHHRLSPVSMNPFN
jgi:hypothetical protein